MKLCNLAEKSLELKSKAILFSYKDKFHNLCFVNHHVELLFDTKIALSLLDLDTQRYIPQ